MTAIAPLRGRTSGQEQETWSSLFSANAVELGPDVCEMINDDEALESSSVNLIASASYCPRGLREIEGTHLVNRSPMGLPRRRTVANCQYLDAIEELAVARAEALFGAEYVNVQALSSTLANVAVLHAILPTQGGSLLAFDELSGGHVSHGAARHITGDARTVHRFGVLRDGTLDLETARRTALEFRPDVIVAGPSTYPREMDFAGLRAIADEAGSLLVTDIAHVAGLIVAGIHANPVPFADLATTSTQKTLCGPRNGAFVFAKSRFREAIDAAIYPGLQGPAAANLIAARAVQLDVVTRPAFKMLMQKVVDNARALCEGFMEGGAALYTGGTDSHMVVAYAGEEWTQAELVAKLGAYGVLGNAIRAPGNDGRPRIAFRLGTVAMTIRGLVGPEFLAIGSLLAGIIAAGPSAALNGSVKLEISNIAEAHPVPSYPE